nr:thymosin beta isoform X1 [Drosophila suzukii]
MAAPAPALKDLPKVAENLKSQLEGFNQDKLKNASTQEKIILPTAEGELVVSEGLMANNEKNETQSFRNADVAAEKTQQSIFEGITAFNQNNLKHTETHEKNPLPDKEAIEQEKEKNQFIAGIENFDAKKLKHTETNEKNVLPTKEVIEAEKQA